MKINCVIVDDEPENLKYLQQIVEDIDGVAIIKSFTDGESFKEGIANLKFDMCILDNRLPDTTGVKLSAGLKNVKVIFVSAHEISAYDAFDAGAVDVLRKPVSKDRLEKAIRKCRDKIINEKGYVFIKTSEGKTRFKLNQIVYIKSEENTAYKLIMTNDGNETKTLKMTLENILLKLPHDQFCLINKGTILNSLYFKTFGKDNTVVLDFKLDNKPQFLQSGEKYLAVLSEVIGLEPDQTA